MQLLASGLKRSSLTNQTPSILQRCSLPVSGTHAEVITGSDQCSEYKKGLACKTRGERITFTDFTVITVTLVGQ